MGRRTCVRVSECCVFYMVANRIKSHTFQLCSIKYSLKHTGTYVRVYANTCECMCVCVKVTHTKKQKTHWGAWTEYGVRECEFVASPGSSFERNPDPR